MYLRSIQSVWPMWFLLVVGCAPTAPSPVSTKGIVKTKKGVVCDNALVVFHPLETDRLNDAKPVATTNGEGKFALTTFAANDGALPGEYAITIVWPSKDGKAGRLNLSGEGGTVSADRLKGKYGDPSKPLLKATVAKEGSSELSLEVD